MIIPSNKTTGHNQGGFSYERFCWHCSSGFRHSDRQGDLSGYGSVQLRARCRSAEFNLKILKIHHSQTIPKFFANKKTVSCSHPKGKHTELSLGRHFDETNVSAYSKATAELDYHTRPYQKTLHLQAVGAHYLCDRVLFVERANELR